MVARAVGLALVIGLVMMGCGSSQRWPAIPDNLDRTNVAVDTVHMTAEHFKFTPDQINANAGSLVRVELKAIDGTHGFAIDEFGIDVEVEEGQTSVIEFFPPERGEFGFNCSHFCGMGHYGMNGKVVVQ